METADQNAEKKLRAQMRGERDVTPEDTLAELRDDIDTVRLRESMRGMPDVSPEDTRAELLDDQAHAHAKEVHKEQDAEAMRQERLEMARRMSEQQARSRAELDIEEHASILASGPNWEQEAFYTRKDMAERMESNSFYAAALQEKAPELAKRVAENERENVTVNFADNLAKAENARMVAEAVAQGRMPSDTSIREPESQQTGETRMSDTAMKAENARMVAEAVAQGRMPSDTSIREPEYDSQNAERDEQKQLVDQQLDKQLEDELIRRKAREQELAGQGLNSVDVQPTGNERNREEIILPRRITQAYIEVDGKFFSRNTNLVMFEDKGQKLATSTTDKATIADMVALAKAKQWESLKLSGAQEFRREAWLQAESQGIKTTGYTPKQNDLAALEALRQERATNSIIPTREKQAVERTSEQAPRYDLNKNQAVLHNEATKAISNNMHELKGKPGMGNLAVEDLTKLAYWRGIVAEENKSQPKDVQDKALARFDGKAADQAFIKSLPDPKVTQEKTTERIHERTTYEQSL